MKNFLLIMTSLLFLTCSENHDKTNLKVEVRVDKSQALTPPPGGWTSNIIPVPSSASEINCVGVFLGYENLPNSKFCTVELNNTYIDTFNFEHEGGLAFIGSAQQASIEVKDVAVGTPLRVHVLGFKVSSPSKCPLFSSSAEIDNFEPGSNGVSDPYVLAYNIPNFGEGGQINAIFDSNLKISDCQGWDEGGQRCGTVNSYTSLDFPFLDCLNESTSSAYLPDYQASGDVMVVDTNLGGIAKLDISSGFNWGTGTITFSGMVIYDSTGAISGNAGTVTLDATNKCIDLDAGTPSASPSCDASTDLEIVRPNVNNYFIIPKHGGNTIKLVRPGVPSESPQQLEIFDPAQDFFVHSRPYANGPCHRFEVMLTDATRREVASSSNITVDLDDDNFANGNFYSDNGCTSPISSVSITTSSSRAEFFYKATTSSSVYMTAKDSTNTVFPITANLAF
jgi:hypothetical protein